MAGQQDENEVRSLPAGEGWLTGTLVEGRRKGDRYYRVRRAELPGFRRVRGRLVATDAASAREDALGRVLERARDFLVGRPLDTEAAERERLPIFKALPILSSDALSSVAYGPEAGLAVLAAAGAGAFLYSIPIGIAVAILMLVVTSSYMQVVRGYPAGGGSYAVAAANLGLGLGLVAAASLLVDYVLTVSVSISSGVDAAISAFAALGPYKIVLALGFLGLLMLGNLRGVREAGTVFAGPTYLFLACILLMIAVGLVRFAFGGAHGAGHYAPVRAGDRLSLLLVLTAFASACSSMTGIEAISNSVPSFRTPVARNAERTLAVLGILLVVLFLGVVALDVIHGAEPRAGGYPTVLSQLALVVFTGWASPLYYLTQVATLAILILAANTSFNGFPRLAAVLARDDLLPHRLGQLGNRLVFSTAILFLAGAAGGLIVGFAGNVNELINLYALGVFTAFTLAQSGMARHWLRERGPRWRYSFAVNVVGAVATGLVDLVIIYTKSPRGAWIVLVVVPLLMALFLAISHHYQRVREQLSVTHHRPGVSARGPILVPVGHVNRATTEALRYAGSLGKDVVAIHVARDERAGHRFAAAWHGLEGVPLRVVSGSRPVSIFLRELAAEQAKHRGSWTTVVLPEGRQPFWHELVHQPRVVLLKLRLLLAPGVVAASLPAPATGQLLEPEAATHRVAFVPIARLDAPAVKAISYAADLFERVVVVHVSAGWRDQEESEQLRRGFNAWIEEHGIAERASLVVIESPFRAVSEPLLYYFVGWRRRHPGWLCTVVLPELVDPRPWVALLHNHRAFWLKRMLLRHSTIAVADVTYQWKTETRQLSAQAPAGPGSRPALG